MLRLDGLMLRAQGWSVIRLPQYQQELALSNDQLQRIDRLLAAATGENGQLTEQQDAAVIRVLTRPQQQTLSRLLGADFPLPKSWRYCRAPGFPEISTWINTSPLDVDSLSGKVVVVHFWAFGCINCIHNIPHYEAWFQKYRDRDLVIVGIHTPETSTEREVDAVRTKVAENKMQYPIAIDGAAATWNAWANSWWPSVYLVDKHGYVRYWWYGELNWKDAKGEELMRRRIDELLTEN
ncbi:MAG: redoxin domain-containing protein [Planctomycetaceae bacterium]